MEGTATAHLPSTDDKPTNHESSIELEELSKIHCLTAPSIEAPLENSLETHPEAKIPKTFLQKIKKYSVVEPFLLLFVLSVAVRAAVNSQFMLVKACMISHNLTEEVCRTLPRNSSIMIESQQEANNIQIYGQIVGTLPQLVVGVLLGAFCDKYGRKGPLLIAPIGMALQLVGTIFAAVDMKQPLYWLVVYHIPTGLTGGMMVVLAGVYSHLTSVTPEKERPNRFAILDMCLIIGMGMGNILGGALYDLCSFAVIYGLSLAAAFLGILHLTFTMKENNELLKELSWKGVAQKLCSLDSVKESFHTCLRKRSGNARLLLWLLILSCVFIQMPIMSANGVLFYFTQVSYGWLLPKYTYINTAIKQSASVLCAFAMRLLVKRLRLREAIIAIIGLSLLFGEMFVRGLSSSAEELFFVAYAFGIFGGISGPAVKSLLSKIVSREEIGKVFTILSIGESLTPMVGSSVFLKVYNLTVAQGYPGVVFLVSAGMFLFPLSVVIYILISGALSNTKEEKKKNEQGEFPELQPEVLNALDRRSSVVEHM